MAVLSGFVKIHRKLINWCWYQNNEVKSLFLHCIFMANFRDTQWQSFTIKRGQFVTSLKHLSDETGLTTQEIRTAIKKLKSTGEITSTSTSKYTIITVENFEDYQYSDLEVTSTLTQTATNQQQTNNKPITNQQQQRKNDKNNKNKALNTYDDFFEIAWSLFPNKKGKTAVSKKSKMELEKIGLKKITLAIENYKRDIAENGTDKKFVMYGSTFFNGRYKDYLECDSSGVASTVAILPKVDGLTDEEIKKRIAERRF